MEVQEVNMKGYLQLEYQSMWTHRYCSAIDNYNSDPNRRMLTLP
jgi:hypothetical protein